MWKKIIELINAQKQKMNFNPRQRDFNRMLEVGAADFFDAAFNLINAVEAADPEAIGNAAEELGTRNRHATSKQLGLKFDKKELDSIINLISKYLESKNSPSKEIIIEKIKKELA